jgi:hypothetical protein
VLNRPVVWWGQGEEGGAAAPGGVLRLLGKNLLGPGKTATVVLQGAGKTLTLSGTGDVWSLSVALPGDAAEGDYRVYVHNGYGGASGWSEGLAVTVRKPEVWPSKLFSVADYGATGNGGADQTAAVQAALAAAGAAGGGVVYFPRGVYQLTQPLTVPRLVVLRGEATDLTALFWPDTDTPPKQWILGTNHFGLENLTLYCSNYLTFLGAEQTAADAGSVFLRQVRVRADIYRGHEEAQVQEARYRQGLGGFGAGHWLIQLGGSDNVVEDCDLYSSGCVIGIREARDCVIRHNQLGSGRWGGSGIFGGERVILEGNRYYGASLTSWGGAGGVGYGNLTHLYIGHNSMTDAHGGDSEQITSDAAGGFFYGKADTVGADSVTLPATAAKPGPRWVGAAVYVVSGTGMGQWRRVTAYDGDQLTLDRPWQVTPDATSLLEITFQLSQWVISDNRFADVGISVQLYGDSIEEIVAGNTCARAAGYQAIGKDYGAYKIPPEQRTTHQPTWYCQFLNNTITEGNIYRSGANNDILAGPSVVAVWGWPPALDWPWPLAYGEVIRGNNLENNSLIHVGGSRGPAPSVRDVVVEHNTIAKSDTGVELDAGTTGMVVRDNHCTEVAQPLAGAGMARAWVPAPERLTAWLESVRTALRGPGEGAGLDAQLAAWLAEAGKLPDKADAVAVRRGEMAAQLGKLLGGQPQGLVSPAALQALAGVQLTPQPDSSSLKQILGKGQGGTGQITVSAALAGDAAPVALSARALAPEGWPAAAASAPVTLAAGGQATLALPVQAPAGAWGRWTIPVEVEATWEGARLTARLPVSVGHGTVSNWYVIGPFSHPAKMALDETPHPPEYRLDLKAQYPTPAGPVAWQPVAGQSRLDLAALLGPGQNETAYAVTVIHAARETTAQVTLKTEEGAMVWLQGQDIPGLKLEKAGTVTAGVTLAAGDNIFLLKISNLTGPWTAELGVDEMGAGAGGSLTAPAPAQMLALPALAPAPLPVGTPGQTLSWSEGVAWKLVATDDFPGVTLDPRWNVASGQWKVADGVLMGQGPAALLALRDKIPAPLRIEYDCCAPVPGDLSAFWLDSPPDYNSGYLWGFGSGGNTEDKILFQGDYLAQASKPLPVANQWAHVIAQILPGNRLQLIVDDKLALDAPAGRPVVGGKYPGLWTWGAAEFRNVRIYSGSM